MSLPTSILRTAVCQVIYVHMEIEYVDEQLGAWESRQERTRELAQELSDFLKQIGYRVLGPQPTVTERKINTTDFHKNLTPDTILVEYRAKASAAIASKLARFGER